MLLKKVKPGLRKAKDGVTLVVKVWVTAPVGKTREVDNQGGCLY